MPFFGFLKSTSQRKAGDFTYRKVRIISCLAVPLGDMSVIQKHRIDLHSELERYQLLFHKLV